MKKLVKTARQQFEERLEHFNLMQDWNNQCSFGRIGKDLDGEGVVIFIHESEEDGFSEYHYPSFSELRDDSNFVQNCLKEFSCVEDEFILSMVRWFTYESTENPFDAVDIYFPADTFKLNSSVEFHDLYEEVPDVSIITAKEQWEEDSKNAKTSATLDNGSIYKVEVTEQAITFYVFKGDCYTKSVFPPFSELRKDNKFIVKYLELVRMSHDGDMDYALSWLAGGEYKMCELSLLDIYESATEIEGLEYEDKELPQEQPIEEKYFSTEITDLKERMTNYILELYDKGLRLNSTSFLGNSYAIIWASGCFYECANIRYVYLRESVENGFEFSYECKNDEEGDSSNSQIEELSIETLYKIIDAMY